MKQKEPTKATNKRPASQASPTELYAMGKRLRDQCPLSAQAEWKAPEHRPDPLRLLEQSNEGRIPELIPIRFGRMVQTPFTFYRGAALNMASDLAHTPVSGLRVQACGDCHLLNFGGYATPERRLVFDINDLDETLPAPWEWDVKRLAASIVLACRNNGFSVGDTRDAALSCARAYRERMAEYSQMMVLDVWYASIDIGTILPRLNEKVRRRLQKRVAAARARDVSEHHFPGLVTVAGQVPTIKDSPPLLYHPTAEGKEDLVTRAHKEWSSYLESLQDDRRALIDHYELKDIAIKVVGVGSVGTYCCVLLLMAGEQDFLLLQAKEARASVLEAYAGKSIYQNQGQRVVNGYHLMQAASDIFLGWGQGPLGRQVYIRQLRDMKMGALVDQFRAAEMAEYADLCGWTLARAHARSGAPAQISGYLGNSDAFDKAIAAFATAYADQSERDYALLEKAVRSGAVTAVME